MAIHAKGLGRNARVSGAAELMLSKINGAG